MYKYVKGNRFEQRMIRCIPPEFHHFCKQCELEMPKEQPLQDFRDDFFFRFYVGFSFFPFHLSLSEGSCSRAPTWRRSCAPKRRRCAEAQRILFSNTRGCFFCVKICVFWSFKQEIDVNCLRIVYDEDGMDLLFVCYCKHIVCIIILDSLM